MTSNANLLLKDDIQEGDLNRPEMTAKLLCTLETAFIYNNPRKTIFCNCK